MGAGSKVSGLWSLVEAMSGVAEMVRVSGDSGVVGGVEGCCGCMGGGSHPQHPAKVAQFPYILGM